MNTFVVAIVSAIQSSLVNNVAELQQNLNVEVVPVQAIEGIITFTIPKSQKLFHKLQKFF